MLPVWLPWVLIGLSLLAALWIITVGLRALRLTGSCGDSEISENRDHSENCGDSPFVSVIVYSAEPSRLEKFIDQLESQTMTDREIIIVNDAGHEATAALAERYADHKGLYFTFMPVDSRNVSRLKLAYTLGIKAARGEVVLTTSSDCTIPSDNWLAQMTAPLKDSEFTDIVLGFCKFDCSAYGSSRWWREFEEVTTASQWIASALDGHPYRGDRHNLAFRRRLFFEQDGYSATNHLHTGDDDIFIAAIAEAGNTRVVLSPESIMEYHPERGASEIWTDRKIRYRFTAQWLPRRSFRIASWTRFMQWLAISGAVAAGTTGWCVWQSPWESVAGGLTLICLWGFDIAAYRRAASRLGLTRLWWSVVPFMLWQPVAGLLFNLSHHSERNINFTWQKDR